MQASEDPVVKNHYNLPTFQRRLRHLQSIAVRNLNCPGDQEIDLCNLTVFFTLHKKIKQEAFYTSEKITGSLNPTWQSFGLQRRDTSIDLSAKSVIVRIWCGHGDVFKVKMEAEVNFSGLLFFSNRFQVPGIRHQTDTLLFGLFSNIFIYFHEASGNQQLQQLIPDTEPAKGDALGAVRVDQFILRPSYNTSNLKRIHMVQRAITQTLASVKRIHTNIEDRLMSSNENAEKLSQREDLLMKVRQLRQELLWQTQQKQVDQDKFEKFQTVQNSRLNTLREKGAEMKKLAQDTEEKRTLHIQSREMLVKENAQVLFRRKQIIKEMVHDIYPITEDEKGQHFYICNVRLPNAEDYQGQDELRVSVALGFTCHLTQMISHFMDLPLRYPMMYRGSRSVIIDHIHSKLTEKDREFPLFGKGKEKFQYNYAVFLLNKNISQLRFYCGFGTNDLRQTLPNLKSLLEQRLGVRSSSVFGQRGDISTLQSPPATSIVGSQTSRVSQIMSSNASSVTRRDLVSELDIHTPPISRSTSATGEGISLNSFGENTLRMGHSISFPQATNSSLKLVSTAHDSFEYSLQDNSSPQNSHALTKDNVYDPQIYLGHKDSSSTSSKSRDTQENENVIKEEDETEDILRPADNFFRVANQQDIAAVNKLFQDTQNHTASSSFDNGIIPKSDIFLDTTQRSFKLVKTPAMSSTPESDLVSNSYHSQSEEISSPNGYHTETSDSRHSHTHQFATYKSMDQDGSSHGPPSSCDDDNEGDPSRDI
uniref:C2 domain-containing protein n=1 Tax=Arion vulgaris TaxID=1028688 RepID=A0A0B6ZKD3_9EUPU